MPATIKDVQKHTGFSLSTISKYINGGKVKEKTKVVLEAAVRELGFVPNQNAKNLRSSNSFTVGILMPSVTNQFSMEVCSAITGYLAQNGYYSILCDCGGDPKQESGKAAFLCSKQIDGLIVMPSGLSGKKLKMTVGDSIPVVLIDRLYNDYRPGSVTIENRGVSAEAANILLDRTKNIAVISAPGVYTGSERIRGFCDACARYSISDMKSRIFDGRNTVAGGYNAMMALWQGLRTRGVFVTNYEMTIGTMMAVEKLGIRVPEELYLIGFDNLELSEVVKPGITTVCQPMAEIGRSAADMLLKRIRGEVKSGEDKVLQAYIIEKESTHLSGR